MRNTVTHPFAPSAPRMPFIILLLGRIREYITAGTTAGISGAFNAGQNRRQNVLYRVTTNANFVLHNVVERCV